MVVKNTSYRLQLLDLVTNWTSTMATEESLISVPVPPALLNRLKAYQNEQKIGSAATAITKILEDYLGKAEAVTPIDRLESLEAKVESLTRQVEQLRQALALYQLNSTPPLAPHVNSIATSTRTGSVALNYEEIEDEPDEILYGFLEPGSSLP
jgi:hypothetical protein